MSQTESEKWARDALRSARQNEHHQWFEQHVEALRTNAEVTGEPIADPGASVREALGYATGFLSREEATEVYEAYVCPHPFFGAPTEWAGLSLNHALEIGVQTGMQTVKQAAMEQTAKAAEPREPSRAPVIIDPTKH